MKHEGQKDHKCKICGKSYYTTSDLKKHIQCVHEKQNPICSLCGKVFSMVCALNKHIRTQHEGLKREEKIPCEICTANSPPKAKVTLVKSVQYRSSVRVT